MLRKSDEEYLADIEELCAQRRKMKLELKRRIRNDDDDTGIYDEPEQPEDKEAA